jgi:hypothetical protein
VRAAAATAAWVVALAWAAQAVLTRRLVLRGEPDWSAEAHDLLGWVVGLGLVAGWVAASLWLTRARELSRRLYPEYPQARAAGWAWFGWVVPVVCLWFPYQLLRDVRAASDDGRRTPLAGRWWTLWLLNSLGFLVLGLLAEPGSGEHPDASAVVALLTAAAGVAAAAQWTRLTGEVDRLQRAVRI